MEKYKPKKVFIINGNDYMEITYEQLCNDQSLNDKMFLVLHGMLLEVTEKDYYLFYKEKNRQRYICREESRRNIINYDTSDLEEHNNIDLYGDKEYDLSKEVILNIMIERLHYILNLLNDFERQLIEQYFFDEIPQTELAKRYGVNQSNISRKIDKILKN